MTDTLLAMGLIILVGFIIGSVWNMIAAHLDEKRWRRYREDQESAALIRHVRYGHRDTE